MELVHTMVIHPSGEELRIAQTGAGGFLGWMPCVFPQKSTEGAEENVRHPAS